MTQPVVLVHGAWVTPASWDKFRQPFEKAGFDVHAPAWPFLERASVEDFRARPPMGFGALSLGQIADHYEALIKTLPAKPIIIGHSFGGLVAQMLLDRGLGCAGVAISPAPIGGIVPGPSALLAIGPALFRLNGWNRPYALSPKRFNRLFANTAPPPLQAQAYKSLAIPAPGRIFFQGSFWLGTWVDPRARKQPLLITAGEKDHLVSPYLARAAFNHQRRSSARTDFKVFAGRSHFIIGELGWDEVARYIIDWTDRFVAGGNRRQVPEGRPPAEALAL